MAWDTEVIQHGTEYYQGPDGPPVCPECGATQSYVDSAVTKMEDGRIAVMRDCLVCKCIFKAARKPEAVGPS